MSMRIIKLTDKSLKSESKSIVHQKQLKEQLSKYIKIASVTDEAKRNLALANALTSHGFCYGFTLTDAAFESVGMLNWWEAALKAIAEWKGTKEELATVIRLPNSEVSHTLDSILFKTLNYIVYHFASVDPKEMIQISGLTQPELIKSGNPFFEIDYKSTEGIKTKRVFDKATATGALTKEMWCSLINPDNLSGNICLIHSSKHIIRISYNSDMKKWIAYDPNYPIDAMHRYFDSEQEVFNEIQSRLHTSTIAINLITLTPQSREEQQNKIMQLNKFKACYTSILRDHPIELMNVKNNFMMLMMKYQPDVLTSIISSIPEMKDDAKETYINILCDSLKMISKKKLATNLYAMLSYAPQCFDVLIQLAANEKNALYKATLVTTLVECLTHVTGSGKTGINLLEKKGSISPPLSEWIAEYAKSQPDKSATASQPIKSMIFKTADTESLKVEEQEPDQPTATSRLKATGK